MIAKGVVTSQQLYQENYLQTMKQQQIEQKQVRKAERFSSGIAEQHRSKKPGKNTQMQLPG